MAAINAFQGGATGTQPAPHSRRRSDYDITNTVRVSSASEVMHAVGHLLGAPWPDINTRPVERAFHDFEQMFTGRAPGYSGVDTVYHDLQHTLDVTLAMARLMCGYERQVEKLWQLGGERAVAGIVMAIFHDVGYLRRANDATQMNGAEFTRTHVTRGTQFLNDY